VVIDQLARALVAKGHEVTLFATGDSSCPVERRSTVDVAPGVYVGGPSIEQTQVESAYAAFRGFDLIHDHTTIGPLYGLEHHDGPVVTTNHNPFVDPFLSVYQAIDGRIPIVAISAHHRSTARTLTNISVIHHGIDPGDLVFGAQSGEYALFLGRMSSDKGVVDAIEIAREAKVPLLIGAKMTSDEEIAYFEDHVEPLLGGRVRFLGEVSFHDKRKLLAGARCLLNPINWDEPFGMAMLEALASGTPVIARRRGAAPEIVEDEVSGFILDTNAEMATALGRIGEIDRAQCLARVMERFSPRAMAEAHLALYLATVAGWRSRTLPINRQLTDLPQK
jgi:glycosyltransferase involved in cell wall biosynthesis